MTDRARSPRLGYLLAAGAATLWAVNGSLARYLLDDGVSGPRLAQLRAVITVAAVLAALVLGGRRDLLRVRREDVARLAALGVGGFALVSGTYFVAIDHLEIGVALAIQYVGPLLVLLWLRVVHGRRLPRVVWAAVAVSLVGCALVVRAYEPGGLSVLGVAAAAGAAVTFAFYLVAGERAGHRYQPATTLAWGFGFATLFWAVVLPWWSFPFGHFHSLRNVALGLGIGIEGTLIPFVLMIEAVRHIPASRAAIVATLEPVLATIVAYFVHDEALAPVQIAGGLLVVGAVIWVQWRAGSLAAEAAPAYRARAAATAAPAAGSDP